MCKSGVRWPIGIDRQTDQLANYNFYLRPTALAKTISEVGGQLFLR